MTPRIAKSEMPCHLCRKAIKIGDQYLRDGDVRAHAVCMAHRDERLGQINGGDIAGPAKNGRVIRGTNNLGG